MRYFRFEDEQEGWMPENEIVAHPENLSDERLCEELAELDFKEEPSGWIGSRMNERKIEIKKNGGTIKVVTVELEVVFTAYDEEED